MSNIIFDAVETPPRHHGQTVRRYPTRAQQALQPDWFERLGAALGAGVIGATVGFVATLSLGRIEPLLTAQISGPIYLAALVLTGETVVDGFRRRALVLLLLSGVLIAALAAWPLAFLIAAPSSPTFWVGAPASLCAVLALAAVAPLETRAVSRSCMLAFLVAALAMHQGTLFLMQG